MRKLAWIGSGLALGMAISALALRATAPVRTIGLGSLDVSTWESYRDDRVGWSLAYPQEWRLQVDDHPCTEHDQILVTNLTEDVRHPDVGDNGCTDLWDMRGLPASFAIIELETPAGPSPGPQGSQRATPLSLDEAFPGSRTARLGVPRGVWFPVWIDRGHQYLVRAWFGPHASPRDREAARLVVESIRFAAER